MKCTHSDLRDIHCVKVENIINIFALNLTDQFILTGTNKMYHQQTGVSGNHSTQNMQKNNRVQEKKRLNLLQAGTAQVAHQNVILTNVIYDIPKVQ